MRSNEEIADLIVERLWELSPAVSVSNGEEPWQVTVEITMARNAEGKTAKAEAEEET